MKTIRHEDLMIWDSGFGFDIVECQSRSEGLGLKVRVKKITDSCIVSLVGEYISVGDYELYEYTDKALKYYQVKYPAHKYKVLPSNISYT